MTTGLDIQQTLRDIGLLGLRTVVGATFRGEVETLRVRLGPAAGRRW